MFDSLITRITEGICSELILNEGYLRTKEIERSVRIALEKELSVFTFKYETKIGRNNHIDSHFKGAVKEMAEKSFAKFLSENGMCEHEIKGVSDKTFIYEYPFFKGKVMTNAETEKND